MNTRNWMKNVLLATSALAAIAFAQPAAAQTSMATQGNEAQDYVVTRPSTEAQKHAAHDSTPPAMQEGEAQDHAEQTSFSHSPYGQ